MRYEALMKPPQDLFNISQRLNTEVCHTSFHKAVD